MMNECLLSLIAPPALEETLVDWLLERKELSGFSSVRIDGHGTRPSELSLAEQVTGRQRKVLFHVHASFDDVNNMLEALRERFRGAGLHYWIMPLVETGRIA